MPSPVTLYKFYVFGQGDPARTTSESLPIIELSSHPSEGKSDPENTRLDDDNDIKKGYLPDTNSSGISTVNCSKALITASA